LIFNITGSRLKKIIIKINAFIKGLVLAMRPHAYLGWLRSPFFFLANTLSLTKWIARQDIKNTRNDFYTLKRDYSKRYKLYRYVSERFDINNIPFVYIEFGVAGAHSFRWWVSQASHKDCSLFGFDTFEGLPEAWGTFKKSDMSASVPDIDDPRVKFFKGLFQDTVPDFLRGYDQKDKRMKIIHLDADLFSSTLYALTSMAPFLRKGDILIFDEFNVPNHEYLAYRLFSEAYYIKTRLIGAVNNYLQVALIIE
jgi:O-methyltransferase